MMAAMFRLRRAVTWLAVAGALLSFASAQVTESPATVAPGRFLLEMDGIKLSMDRADAAGNTYSALGVASTLVSTGLTRDLDIQVGFDLFYRQTTEYRGASESDSGIGDVTLRTKWTFWRHAGWGSAAVIPYVKLPTNSGGIGNDSVEGGLVVPWAMPLGGGGTAGAMAQWDVVRNDAGSGYDSHWFASAYVEQPVALGFALYGEAMLEAASAGLSDWAGMIGGGALWAGSEHIQLDYQLLRGLNSRASAWTHVLRVNWEW